MSGILLMSGIAFAETAAEPVKQSLGTQAGQKAAELKKTGESAYNTVKDQAQKTTEEVKKTSEDSAKIFKEEVNKTWTDLQASFNKALQDLNRQVEDFKAQYFSKQTKTT